MYPNPLHRSYQPCVSFVKRKEDIGLGHTIGGSAASSRLAGPFLSPILPDKLQNILQIGFVDPKIVGVEHHRVHALQCDAVLMSGKNNAHSRDDQDCEDCN